MAQHAFFYNQARCNGCKTCEMACKDAHDLPADRKYNRIFEVEGSEGWTQEGDFSVPKGLFSYFVQMSCNHCDSPACVSACPTGACAKDGKTGIVSIDPEVCNGSALCITACPYSVPVLNPDTNKGEKCDACKARLAEGEVPVCVAACPQRALTCGDASEAPEGFERAALFPLPEPVQTNPNLYVKPSKSAQPSGSSTGKVVNIPEVE